MFLLLLIFDWNFGNVCARTKRKKARRNGTSETITFDVFFFIRYKMLFMFFFWRRTLKRNLFSAAEDGDTFSASWKTNKMKYIYHELTLCLAWWKVIRRSRHKEKENRLKRKRCATIWISPRRHAESYSKKKLLLLSRSFSHICFLVKSFTCRRKIPFSAS